MRMLAVWVVLCVLHLGEEVLNHPDNILSWHVLLFQVIISHPQALILWKQQQQNQPRQWWPSW